jgi:hypothetical protein
MFVLNTLHTLIKDEMFVLSTLHTLIKDEMFELNTLHPGLNSGKSSVTSTLANSGGRSDASGVWNLLEEFFSGEITLGSSSAFIDFGSHDGGGKS